MLQRDDARTKAIAAQGGRARAKNRPVTLARVEKEICMGCRVNVPPQLQIELLRGARLITCMNCHRILIHENALEATPK